MSVGNKGNPVAPHSIRGVAGRLVTGVSVVVTMADGEPIATTAGSVVAASWDPPLLAVLFQTGSRMDLALGRCGGFTVNVLGEADHGLARHFAQPDRAQGWAGCDGVPMQRRDPLPPVFSGAVTWVDCEVVQTVSIGDHRCYIGEVLDLNLQGDNAAAPLVYYRGRFRGLGAAVAPAAWMSVAAADLAAAW
jgi:flavin reductase (DIM6/NTAB) family NADH-FMN oxidoreductase RutF